MKVPVPGITYSQCSPCWDGDLLLLVHHCAPCDALCWELSRSWSHLILTIVLFYRRGKSRQGGPHARYTANQGHGWGANCVVLSPEPVFFYLPWVTFGA